MDLERFREMLLALRRRLTVDVSHLSDEAFRARAEAEGTGTPAAASAGEQGLDTYEHEFTLGLLHNQEQTLDEITEALARIDKGTFGRCEECSGTIPRARLQRSPIPVIAYRVPGSSSNLEDPIMPERSYRVLLWSLALTGLLVDQASKYGVFGWLHGVESNTYALFQSAPETRSFAVVPAEADPTQRARQRGFFLEVAFESSADARGRPVPHVNHGALFGFLRDYKTAANGGFALISLLAAAAILFWSSQKATAADRWLCAALGLILAGTLGNFYDRLMFNGVRDFLHWNYYFDWPVFNFADCCLVVGASLLLLQAFLFPHPAAQQAESEAEKKTLADTAPVAGVACGASSGERM